MAQNRTCSLLGLAFVWVLAPSTTEAQRASVSLVPGYDDPSFALVSEQNVRSDAGSNWRAEKFGAVLRLYGPVISTDQFNRNFHIPLEDVCVPQGSCGGITERVEIRYVDAHSCPLTTPLPECARRVDPEQMAGTPFINFRSPQRFSSWRGYVPNTQFPMETIVLERRIDEVGYTLLRDSLSSSAGEIRRRPGRGVDGAVYLPPTDTQPGELLFRTPDSLRLLSIGSARENFFPPDLGSGLVFTGGDEDPIEVGSEFQILDETIPGERLVVATCSDGRGEALLCELTIDRHYKGAINCGPFAHSSCSIRLVDEDGATMLTVPRGYLALDAWFGLPQLDSALPCCRMVSNAFALRVR